MHRERNWKLKWSTETMIMKVYYWIIRSFRYIDKNVAQSIRDPEFTEQ